ncbi:MAG: GNAT family N-acetyltransferase [Rhodobacteraceae bacterium]|nr:GNAT family N-acetyltransferase [Paracoccaceae bacterium]
MKTTADFEQIHPRPLSGEIVKNLPSGLIPARTPLVGKLVTLEPQDAARHASELFEASHSTEDGLKIWDHLTYGPWPNAEQYAATIRSQSASQDTVFYAIRAHESGKACGQASFLDIHAENGVTEIGHIWFGPELQRTKAATEALFLMLCYAMDEQKYRRMQWRCNALNAKSRKAAQRLGFRFEGIFYNHLIFKGMNRDTAWYSILDDEWPEAKEKIGNWLADSNFTASGEARTSLFDAMQKRTPSTRRIE